MRKRKLSKLQSLQQPICQSLTFLALISLNLQRDSPHQRLVMTSEGWQEIASEKHVTAMEWQNMAKLMEAESGHFSLRQVLAFDDSEDAELALVESVWTSDLIWD